VERNLLDQQVFGFQKQPPLPQENFRSPQLGIACASASSAINMRRCDNGVR